MPARKQPALVQQPPLVTDATVLAGVRVAAHTALILYRQALECASQTILELLGAGALAATVYRQFTHLNVRAKYWDSRNGPHARLEGEFLTLPRETQPSADMVADVAEGVSELLRHNSRRTRGCYVVIGLAPEGSLAKVNSALRTWSRCLPPGVELLPHDAEPMEVITAVCRDFSVPAERVEVFILQRPWNAQLAEAYGATGATVRLIPCGDFRALVEAGTAPTAGGPVYISVGTGGTTEAVLAAIHSKATGAQLHVQQVPEGKEMMSGCPGTVARDADQLIRSQDCMLFCAGVVAPNAGPLVPFVPGVRESRATDTRWVCVTVTSPAFAVPQRYVVEYAGEQFSGMTLLAPDELLDDHLVSRFLAEAGEVESRLSERPSGDIEYFTHWRGCVVPGLDHYTERDLLALLGDMLHRGRLVRREQVCDWDSSEYRVTWQLAQQMSGD